MRGHLRVKGLLRLLSQIRCVRFRTQLWLHLCTFILNPILYLSFIRGDVVGALRCRLLKVSLLQTLCYLWHLIPCRALDHDGARAIVVRIITSKLIIDASDSVYTVVLRLDDALQASVSHGTQVRATSACWCMSCLSSHPLQHTMPGVQARLISTPRHYVPIWRRVTFTFHGDDACRERMICLPDARAVTASLLRTSSGALVQHLSQRCVEVGGLCRQQVLVTVHAEYDTAARLVDFAALTPGHAAAEPVPATDHGRSRARKSATGRPSHHAREHVLDIPVLLRRCGWGLITDATTVITARAAEFICSPRDLSFFRSAAAVSTKKPGFISDVTAALNQSIATWPSSVRPLALIAQCVLTATFTEPCATDTVLLSGPRGCGKSTLIHTIVQTLSRCADTPIAWFHPISYSNLITLAPAAPARGLRLLYERAKTLCPAVLAFDDLDALFPRLEGGATVKCSC